MFRTGQVPPLTIAISLRNNVQTGDCVGLSIITSSAHGSLQFYLWPCGWSHLSWATSEESSLMCYPHHRGLGSFFMSVFEAHNSCRPAEPSIFEWFCFS